MAENNSFAINCAANEKNTGLSKLCQDIGTIVGYIVCPANYEIDTAVNAKLLATWTTAIQAAKGDRVYPFPAVFLMEDNSEDAVFQEGSVSSLFVRDGKINFDMTHESSRYKHAAMKSHTNQSKSVYLIDQQGRIHGVSPDDVVFKAVNLDTFVVQKLKVNNGTDATTTKTTMIFADGEEWQLKPAVVKPTDFNPKNLEGLCDVLLSETGTPTTSEVIIDADVFRSGDPVLGLSETIGEDWTVKNAAGAEQTITTITEDTEGNGTYTFAFGTPLSPDTYTFNLKSSETMTTEGYESLGAVTITFP
jgi:hypothetical protein